MVSWELGGYVSPFRTALTKCASFWSTSEEPYIDERIAKTIAVTKDTVVLTRAGWNAIIEALDDATARAAVRASVRRAEAGQDDGLPAVLYRRLRAGEHPIRVWRAHRKLSLNALAERASVARAYLSEIETGKKPGSVAALQRIARVLRVEIDDLVAADRGKPGK